MNIEGCRPQVRRRRSPHLNEGIIEGTVCGGRADDNRVCVVGAFRDAPSVAVVRVPGTEHLVGELEAGEASVVLLCGQNAGWQRRGRGRRSMRNMRTNRSRPGQICHVVGCRRALQPNTLEAMTPRRWRS